LRKSSTRNPGVSLLHPRSGLTLNLEPVLDNLAETRERRDDAVVSRDLAADTNLALRAHDAEERVEHDAAHIVKVPVDVVALEGFLELGGEVGALVVDTCVGAERLDPAALLLAASNANDAFGANDLFGQLDRNRADRADISLVLVLLLTQRRR
jgi:hypothetical protein